MGLLAAGAVLSLLTASVAKQRERRQPGSTDTWILKVIDLSGVNM